MNTYYVNIFRTNHYMYTVDAQDEEDLKGQILDLQRRCCAWSEDGLVDDYTNNIIVHKRLPDDELEFRIAGHWPILGEEDE